MNHPLAVYTVIYVAILFVTVSIWGGKIGDATGDYRVLLLAQAVFALKLAIDDYLHFQDIRKPGNLHLDLNLSLFVYLLLAVSIAMAATHRGAASALFFAVVFAVGVLWLCLSGFEDEAKWRRIWWLVVNIVSMGILLTVALRWPPQSGGYSIASGWLVGLVLVLVIDFFSLGTLRRLAALHGRGDQAPTGVIGRMVAMAAEVPAIPAVASPASVESKEATAATPAPASSAPPTVVPHTL